MSTQLWTKDARCCKQHFHLLARVVLFQIFTTPLANLLFGKSGSSCLSHLAYRVVSSIVSGIKTVYSISGATKGFLWWTILGLVGTVLWMEGDHPLKEWMVGDHT